MEEEDKLRVEEEDKLRVEEEKRVKQEEERAARERVKKEELKDMIKEIKEEVQVNVTSQVVAMLHPFLDDVGVLLRHLLKGGEAGGLNNETTMGTTRALQALQYFDLEESDSESDTDSDSDSEQSDRSEGDSTKGTGRGRNPQHSNVCQCGKAVRKYQTGSYRYHIRNIISRIWFGVISSNIIAVILL